MENMSLSEEKAAGKPRYSYRNEPHLGSKYTGVTLLGFFSQVNC